ncbi:hypothetical protein, partial [Klebsiella pneumoniae]|uniref:hypothetical protein n=1 Tax=Klebsiella pneumoniae TaxID=573 RepID=UPI001C8EFE6F
ICHRCISIVFQFANFSQTGLFSCATFACTLLRSGKVPVTLLLLSSVAISSSVLAQVKKDNMVQNNIAPLLNNHFPFIINL